MTRVRGKITALYERLSRDDEKFGDSTSIVNQKKMLEEYARNNGYANFKHYTDDGYSGGSFDRPGWKELIRDIEDGLVSTVIAKDMSRIGRNYLEVGYYTEVYFGRKDIHFIAVSNNVDSEDQGSSEFAPFLNIMNEWYLRDCSRKIKASKKSLGESGVHLAAVPCYGYRTDPYDKHKWNVDEDAAKVIRLIFQLCIEGKGTQQIADILRDRKIETPAYHNAKDGVGRYKNCIEKLEPYNWNTSSIRTILSRPEYLGHTVNFRTHSKSYKDHKTVANSPDQWVVFRNTQEPIVDLYTYQLAQKLIGTPRRHDTVGEANPLTGLVFCADCGAKMYNHRAKPFIDKHGKRQSGFDNYDCANYKLSSRKTTETICRSHHINTHDLQKVILFAIRNACAYAIHDRKDFLNRVMERSSTMQMRMQKDSKRSYTEDKKRLQDIDIIYKKLYESYALGIITEEKFKMMTESYEVEQKKLISRIKEYEKEHMSANENKENVEGFLELVDRYTAFDELTPQMLNEFVDKVLVHRAEKVNGKRTQKVEVYLNYIGNIDFPQPEKTPEELRQEEIDKYWKDRYERNKDRELARRKRKLKEENEILDAAEVEERKLRIKEFNEDVEKGKLESMPIVPERLNEGA